jgi:hypothetical protein
MAYTTIKKPSDYFNTKLYTGTGSSNAVTGVGFQPDLVWIKNRSQADWHQAFNVVSGASNVLYPNETAAESNASTSFVSFDSDGFTVNTNDGTNGNGESLVAWNWLADNTSGSSNTDGSITSTVSANTTSGFSIVSYTGTLSTDTVGHGLGVAPAMIIIKARTFVEDWTVYHQSVGNTVKLNLNNNDATNASVNYWQNTTPTSSVFYIGANDRVNKSGDNYIAYCFAEKKGFSKFGSYTGNGNADGTFIYTGFKPAFVMIKETNTAGTDWRMMDNKRSTFNLVDDRLFPNLSSAESAGDGYDFLSNGFKIRSSGGDFNGSGDNYIYMAFAEEPLVGDNPATAR